MPTGIYKHKPIPEEVKKKISESEKGRIPWNRGKPLSEEHKKKIIHNHKGHLGYKHSEETKKKLSEARRGQHHSKESKRKMSENHRGGLWKGGITPITKLIRHSIKYAKWRQDVFIRDNFTCQKCKVRGGHIEVHHKKPFYKFIQEAKKYLPLLGLYEAAMIYNPLWDINNGKTLCKKCHKRKGKPKAPVVSKMLKDL